MDSRGLQAQRFAPLPVSLQNMRDVMENISDYLDDDSIKQITSVYADKGYDSKAIFQDYQQQACDDYSKTRGT